MNKTTEKNNDRCLIYVILQIKTQTSKSKHLRHIYFEYLNIFSKNFEWRESQELGNTKLIHRSSPVCSHGWVELISRKLMLHFRLKLSRKKQQPFHTIVTILII